MPVATRVIAVIALCLAGLAVAVPEDDYELQRICWKDGCPARATPRIVPVSTGPPLVYGITDSSVAVPLAMCKSTPTDLRLYTDECRINAILARDDIDAYVLEYNHTTKGRGTTRPINTGLFLLATEHTDNVNVILAAFSDTLPASADSAHKDVAESDVRAQVSGIPATYRMVGSVSLSTRDKVPSYTVAEQGGLNYWTFDNFTSGCALTPPFGPPSFGFPFNLDNCNLSNGLRLNAAGVTLPSAGRVLFVLYEKRGRPVPYIFGTGADSPIDYALVYSGAVPAFLYPQFVLGPQERDILQANLRVLQEVGELTVGGFDVANHFTLI